MFDVQRKKTIFISSFAPENSSQHTWSVDWRAFWRIQKGIFCKVWRGNRIWKTRFGFYFVCLISNSTSQSGTSPTRGSPPRRPRVCWRLSARTRREGRSGTGPPLSPQLGSPSRPMLAASSLWSITSEEIELIEIWFNPYVRNYTYFLREIKKLNNLSLLGSVCSEEVI